MKEEAPPRASTSAARDLSEHELPVRATNNQIQFAPGPAQEQLSLFATQPSTNPIIGLIVRRDDTRACGCGSTLAIIGSGKAMHAACLRCHGCGMHRGWLSAEASDFITMVRGKFGAPEIITLRSNSHTSPGADGEDHCSAPLLKGCPSNGHENLLSQKLHQAR